MEKSQVNEKYVLNVSLTKYKCLKVWKLTVFSVTL